LFKLTEISEKMLSTLKLLTDAKQGKRLEVTLSNLKDQFMFQEPISLVNTPGQVLTVNCESRYSEKTWAVAHTLVTDQSAKAWYAPLLRSSGPASTKWRADYETVLGANLSAASLWKSYPWSWLVDYFINVSDMLDATRGVLPFKLINMNVMAKQSIQDRSTILLNTAGLRYRPHFIEYSVKQRRTWSNPAPAVSLSFSLNMGQFDNLLALLTLGRFVKLARTA
jgi:hypothetical protein